MGQQQVDLRAQIDILGASGIEKLTLSPGVEFQRFRKKRFYLSPAFRGDAELPPILS